MSLHLQGLKSGMTVKVEVRADQRANIDIICRVKKSEIIAEESLPDNITLLTLHKI